MGRVDCLASRLAVMGLLVGSLVQAGWAATPAAPAVASPSATRQADAGVALVVAEGVVLRSAPRASAQALATLAPGELLEVRGERLDWLQVWDHRRERGGFVRAGQLRRTALAVDEAPELLALLRFVQGTPGSEALGIGLAAAWLKAAPAAQVQGAQGAEVLDALGGMAQRLARRASAEPGAAPSTQAASKPQAALSAQLDVAARYGVGFRSVEEGERIRVCYDGDAFARVMAMPQASASQRARAALALTDAACADPALRPHEQAQAALARAEVLEGIQTAGLRAWEKNRIHLRRAGAWSAVAWHRGRAGQLAQDADAAQRGAQDAALRALAELASVQREELLEEDATAHNDATMQVNAIRWAALPAVAATGERPHVLTQAGEPGQTCVLLVDAKNDASRPLARRCTYAQVWPQSASLNREGNALALAVQPLQAWRELWLFRRQGGAWTVEVLPPAAGGPGLGYAEFAGWVPGGKEVLVAREARADGRYRRSYEVVSLDSLVTLRQAPDPQALGPFQRWQDVGWKRMSVSGR
ncbi:MAG TPA: SH3 domain-containing protein [Variovorax sp.]|nr:SH3 domain-containing protein [Variovorax sp.]